MESKKPASAADGRRKPYTKPRLVVYGDVRQLTKAKNSGGQNDGSGHPNKHFTS